MSAADSLTAGEAGADCIEAEGEESTEPGAVVRGRCGVTGIGTLPFMMLVHMFTMRSTCSLIFLVWILF